MINYYRFCCRIRIADEYADEVPGGEFLAVEDGDAKGMRERFADTRVNRFSDWFEESPALLAHIAAVTRGDDRPLKARLVSTEDAMHYTGKPRQTLYRWLNEGKLTGYWHDFGPGTGGLKRAWDGVELLQKKL